MSIVHLSPIDWLIIVIYFFFVLGIGFYLRKQVRSGNDFFLAGRRSSSWLAGLSFLSANMGALELLGMAGNSYKYGALIGHFYWIGAIPAMLFLGIFMMPFYYSSRIHSVPGYLNLRFNEATRTLNAIAFAIMTLLVSGIDLYAMALVLHSFVGWNMDLCIVLSSLTVAVYMVLGGLSSAIYSEVLQFFLIWGGLLLVVILGIVDIGGYAALKANLSSSFFHIWSNTAHAQDNPMLIDWVGIVLGLGFVLSFGYWTTDFLVVQRAFTAKDLRTAQMTPVLASFFKMALPLMVVGAGLITLALSNMHRIEPLTNPDNALLALLSHYYPAGLLGLGITALLAGFMSGQAGNVSAFSTVFAYDIYRAHLMKTGSDRHYVLVGRIATVIGVFISILTAYWAMTMPSIMEYLQALFSIVNAPLFATILLGMFWKRTNGKGAFCGLFIGMTASAISFLLLKFNLISPAAIAFHADASPMAVNFWRAIWAWTTVFSITIIVSLMTSPPPPERINGLVYGTVKTEHLEKGKLSWWQKPTSWSILSLLVLIILNILFW